jgi:hypothetical protein
MKTSVFVFLPRCCCRIVVHHCLLLMLIVTSCTPLLHCLAHCSALTIQPVPMSSPAPPLKGDCCRPYDDANEDNPHCLTGLEGPRERLARLTVFSPLTTAYMGGGSPPSPSSISCDHLDLLDDPDHLTGPEGACERRAGLTVFGPLKTAYTGGDASPPPPPLPRSFRIRT